MQDLNQPDSDSLGSLSVFMLFFPSGWLSVLRRYLNNRKFYALGLRRKIASPGA